MKLLTTIAIGSAAMLMASPAAAQEWPMTPDTYWEVSGIKIDDGAGLKYANHLAGRYRQSQDYAKAQGWIEDYHIVVNSYPRAGEPDVYLIVEFKEMVDPEEGERRAAQYRAHMQTTEEELQAASGERADYRTIMSTSLMRKMKWNDE